MDTLGKNSTAVDPVHGTSGGGTTSYADFSNKVPWRLFSSREDFERVDAVFRDAKDRNGVSMLEIAKRYWDDPDFADQLRAEIEEGKRKRRGH